MQLAFVSSNLLNILIFINKTRHLKYDVVYDYSSFLQYQPEDGKEVERIDNKISTNATGFDDLSVKMLKTAYPCYHCYLTNIVNQSFPFSEVPPFFLEESSSYSNISN